MARFPTLKGSWPWPRPWIRSHCIPSCITHRPLPTWQISSKLKKLFVDGRTYTYVRTDGHLRPALLGRLGRKVDLKTPRHMIIVAVSKKGVAGHFWGKSQQHVLLHCSSLTATVICYQMWLVTIMSFSKTAHLRIGHMNQSKSHMRFHFSRTMAPNSPALNPADYKIWADGSSVCMRCRSTMLTNSSSDWLTFEAVCSKVLSTLLSASGESVCNSWMLPSGYYVVTQCNNVIMLENKTKGTLYIHKKDYLLTYSVCAWLISLFTIFGR